VKIIKPEIITNTILDQTDGSNIPEPDTATTPPEAIYVAETTYAAGEQVIVIATHKVYESLVGSNQGNYPPTDVLLISPKWLEIGATNRWRALDGKIGSKTSQATSITYHLHIPVIDSIALLGLVGTSLSIIVKDITDVEVYNKTVDLTNNDAVIDWYTYFFEEIIFSEDTVHTDLPAAYGSTLDIVITNTGSVALVGEIVIGNVATIGITRADPKPSISIKDYSTKDTDVFGNITIVERTYSKRLSCDLIIYNSELDNIYNLFALYRSTPIVWIGSELYGSMIVYGFYKELDVVIPYPLMSECSLELEGLS